jgi:hypothetical protein
MILNERQDILNVELEELVHNTTNRKVHPGSYYRFLAASGVLFRAVAGGMRSTLFYGYIKASNVVAPSVGVNKMVFKLGDEIVYVVEDEYNNANFPIMFDRIEMMASTTGMVDVGSGTFTHISSEPPPAATEGIIVKNSYSTPIQVWVDGVMTGIANGAQATLDFKTDGSSLFRVTNPYLTPNFSYRLARKTGASAYPLNTAYSTLHLSGDAAFVVGQEASAFGYEIVPG